MSLAARLIYNSKLLSAAGLCIGGLFVLSGCSTATNQLEKRLKINEPVVATFYGKYSEVESALKQAMLKYPQRVDNTEAGIFETDYVKGEARFRAAHAEGGLPNGFRYRILLRLVKGTKDARQAVKVVVVKQGEIVKDFFAEASSYPSDGLEEKVILYRIERELKITRAIMKANQSPQEKSDD